MSRTIDDVVEQVMDVVSVDAEDIEAGYIPELLTGVVRRTKTFEDGMLLTSEKGVILEFKDGDVFYLTVQKR